MISHMLRLKIITLDANLLYRILKNHYILDQFCDLNIKINPNEMFDNGTLFMYFLSMCHMIYFHRIFGYIYWFLYNGADLDLYSPRHNITPKDYIRDIIIKTETQGTMEKLFHDIPVQFIGTTSLYNDNDHLSSYFLRMDNIIKRLQTGWLGPIEMFPGV